MSRQYPRVHKSVSLQLLYVALFRDSIKEKNSKTNSQIDLGRATPDRFSWIGTFSWIYFSSNRSHHYWITKCWSISILLVHYRLYHARSNEFKTIIMYVAAPVMCYLLWLISPSARTSNSRQHQGTLCSQGKMVFGNIRGSLFSHEAGIHTIWTFIYIPGIDYVKNICTRYGIYYSARTCLFVYQVPNKYLVITGDKKLV